LDRKKNFDTHLTDIKLGIRPTDVPGRILNMALLNIGSEDPSLRASAYNLLHSLCNSFRFTLSQQLMTARGNSLFRIFMVSLFTHPFCRVMYSIQ
jgi:neurofibromin 1